MSLFEPERLPPLPVTLEEAHREIRYLQRRLYLERQVLATNIEEREKERRAARGNIRVLADRIAEAKVWVKLVVEAKSLVRARQNAVNALEELSD
jgi:hypothetical protein